MGTAKDGNRRKTLLWKYEKIPIIQIFYLDKVKDTNNGYSTPEPTSSMEIDPSGRTNQADYNGLEGGERGQRRTGRTNSFNGSDSIDQEFIFVVIYLFLKLERN